MYRFTSQRSTKEYPVYPEQFSEVAKQSILSEEKLLDIIHSSLNVRTSISALLPDSIHAKELRVNRITMDLLRLPISTIDNTIPEEENKLLVRIKNNLLAAGYKEIHELLEISKGRKRYRLKLKSRVGLIKNIEGISMEAIEIRLREIGISMDRDLLEDEIELFNQLSIVST